MTTKLSALEQRVTAAEQLVHSSLERRKIQIALLDELRVEKGELEQGLDLVRQREIELRRRRDGLNILHRNSSRLLGQTELTIQLHRSEAQKIRGEVDQEIKRLRSNRFRSVVWAGFGGPKPFPNFTRDEESAVRQLTNKAPPSKLAGRLFAKVPRLYQYVARVREPGPGASPDDLAEEHARRLPPQQFNQTPRNQRYVQDAVEIFEQGVIHEGGEPGALEGLTIKQQEELRKQVRQGAQVIREVVVIEQEGPGAPEVVTSHREKVTHKLRVALGEDKEKDCKRRRPRKHNWGAVKQAQNREGKKPPTRTPVKAPTPPPAAQPTAPTASAPVLDLFPDEEDDFYQELTTFTGEETPTDEHREQGQQEEDDQEEEVTPPRTPVSPNPGDFGTSSPEPEVVYEEEQPEVVYEVERPKQVIKRGRGSNGGWRGESARGGTASS